MVTVALAEQVIAGAARHGATALRTWRRARLTGHLGAGAELAVLNAITGLPDHGNRERRHMSTTDTGSLRDRTRQAIEEYADTLRRHRTQRARSMALGPLSGHLAALLTEWLASGGHDESRRRGDLAVL